MTTLRPALAVILFLAAAGPAPAPPASGFTIDAKWPLPQDAEKAAALRAEKEAWALQGTLGALEKSDGANAPWADTARKVFAAAARRFARESDFADEPNFTIIKLGVMPGGVEQQDFLAALAAATAAGCDDPLVDLWATHFLAPYRAAVAWAKPDPGAQVEGYRRAAKRLPMSGYHPAWRLTAAWQVLTGLRAAQAAGRGGVTAAEVADAEKQFWAAFASAAADPERFARKTVLEVIRLFLIDAHERRRDRVGGWRAIDDALAAANAPESTRLITEGTFLANYAFDARGVGQGWAVDSRDWAPFALRLAGAEECMEAAWKLDPGLPEPAFRMLNVARGLSFPRKDMEVWFRRAMEADPDCYTACENKREYLQPKWRGEKNDAPDFVAQCERTGNWYAGLPLLAEHVYTGDRLVTDDEFRKYYGHPYTWTTTKRVYEGYLAAYPTDRAVRTRYARLCVKSGHREEAARQFEALGDEPWPGYFPSRTEYDRFRAEAKTAGPAKAPKKR